VLVRQIRAPSGWRRRAEYQIAYFRDGRCARPLWVRQGPSISSHIPGKRHPADLHDLAGLVEQAWSTGADAWIAWPVHHPAAARNSDLRAFTPAEAEALEAWRTRSSTPGVDAGPFPVRLARTRRGERVIDGFSHELIQDSSTRCGINRAELEILDQTFSVQSTGACPTCARTR
jgi:hypothetical protein